jgi:F0F1-type ATP synthase assembly protein I
MTGPRSMNDTNQADIAFVIASLLTQVGCFTVVIVGLAIAGGLWLDGLLDTKPVFTIVFVLGSLPVNFYFLVRIVMRGTSQLRNNSQIEQVTEIKEEGTSGRTA